MDEALEITGQTGQARRPSIWRRLTASRYVWAFTGVLLALIVVASSMEESASHAGLAGDRIARFMDASVAQPAPEESAVADLERRRAVAAMSSSPEDNARPAAQDADTGDAKAGVAEPMIAQNASLMIVPANYDRATGSIRRLWLQACGGYIQKLDSDSPAGFLRAEISSTRCGCPRSSWTASSRIFAQAGPCGG